MIFLFSFFCFFFYQEIMDVSADETCMTAELRVGEELAERLALPLVAAVRLELFEENLVVDGSSSSTASPLALPQEFIFPVALAGVDEDNDDDDDQEEEDGRRGRRRRWARFVVRARLPADVVDERQVLLFAFRDSLCNLAGRIAISYRRGRQWRRRPDLFVDASPARSLDVTDRLFVETGDDDDDDNEGGRRCFFDALARTAAVSFRLTGCGARNFVKPFNHREFLRRGGNSFDERFAENRLHLFAADLLSFERRRACERALLTTATARDLCLFSTGPKRPLILAGAYKLPVQAVLLDTDHSPWPQRPRGWLWDYEQGRGFAAAFARRSSFSSSSSSSVVDDLFLTLEYAAGNICCATRVPLAADDYTRLTFPDGADLPSKNQTDRVGGRIAAARRFWRDADAAASVDPAFRRLVREYRPGAAVTATADGPRNEGGRWSVDSVLVAEEGQRVVVVVVGGNDNDDDDDRGERRRQERVPASVCWIKGGGGGDDDGDDSTTFVTVTGRWRRTWSSRFANAWALVRLDSRHGYRLTTTERKRAFLPALIATSQRRLRPALSTTAAATIRRASRQPGWQGRFLPLGRKPFDPNVDLRDKRIVEVQRGFYAPVVNGASASRRDAACSKEEARFVAVW